MQRFPQTIRQNDTMHLSGKCDLRFAAALRYRSYLMLSIFYDLAGSYSNS
jgi:hypothetical protein